MSLLPRNVFEKVFLLDHLDAIGPAEHERICVQATDGRYVRRGVCSLVPHEEFFYSLIHIVLTFVSRNLVTAAGGRRTNSIHSNCHPADDTHFDLSTRSLRIENAFSIIPQLRIVINQGRTLGGSDSISISFNVC